MDKRVAGPVQIRDVLMTQTGQLMTQVGMWRWQEIGAHRQLQHSMTDEWLS